MTEVQIRNKVVNVMRDWLGATYKSAKHYDIVNTYNGHKPLARGYALKMDDAYCAATISAAWIKSGTVSVAVTEVSAPKIVILAQQKGIWVENDAYVPLPGDAIAYDWDDEGYGDNKGSPDHVGIVEMVNGKTITVIEGNMGSAGVVGRRNIQVDGRYIRGYICPNYKSLATVEKEVCKVNVPVLREGSQGGYVKTLQILLNAYYGSRLTKDGIFGSATKKAVMGYQTKQKLTVDGIVGEKTWAELLK